MKKLYLLIFCFTISFQSFSQDIEDFVSKYTDENGHGYLQPMAEVFGANMNSGWYRDAYINHKKFQIYFGLITTTGLIKDNQKTFEGTTDYGEKVELPTIFGTNTPKRVEGPNGLAQNYPGGLSMSILPLAVPQLSVGGLYGTEAAVRFYAADLGEDIGKIDLFGWGLRHSISQYFEDIPVDIALGYYNQQFSLTDHIDANSSIISAQTGYRLGIIDFYGGVGYEFINMEFEYEIEEEDQSTTIQHDYKDLSSVRGTLGAMLNLGVFKLNMDYNLGKSNVFSLGLGFSFGNKRTSL